MPIANGSDIVEIVVKGRDSVSESQINNVFHYALDPSTTPGLPAGPTVETLLTGFRTLWRDNVRMLLPDTYFVTQYTGFSYATWTVIGGHKVATVTDAASFVGSPITDRGARVGLEEALLPTYCTARARKISTFPAFRSRGWVRFGPVPEEDTINDRLTADRQLAWQTVLDLLVANIDADPGVATLSMYRMGVFQKTAWLAQDDPPANTAYFYWRPIKAAGVGLVMQRELGSQLTRRLNTFGS